MVNSVKLKRSASSGAVPTTAQLQLGELAINTYDGRLFTKKNSGSDSIIEFVSSVGTWGISITGNAATVGGKAIGSSGNTIPLLDQVNTWSAQQRFANVGVKVGAGTQRADIDIGKVAAGAVGATLCLTNYSFATPGSSVAIYLAPNDGGGGDLQRAARIESVQEQSGNYADLRFYVAPSDTPFEALRIKSNGNVGIGTYPDVKLDVAGTIRTTAQLVSTVATGTAPLQVTSTTAVTNLNADMVDGKHVGSSGNTIPLLDQANTWSARQVSSFTGNNGQVHLSMFNDANGVTAHWYTNSSSLYLLMSDVGTVPTNNYNALRPFTVNLTTGAVTMSNGLTATLTGNASTATTLQTARNINGTSFNGSANITTANWGNARTLTIGNTGKSVDGSAAVSWSLAEIGAVPLAGGTLTGDITAPRLISNVAQGTAPLGVTSTTVCTNLNADLLDGYHVGTSGGTIPLLNAENRWSALQSISVGGNQLLLHSATSAPTVIFRNDGATFYLLLSDAGASPSGTWNALRPFAFNLTTGAVTIANGLTATLTGNASTATTLQTARTINGTSFNGSANITTANWGTSRAFSIGLTSKAVDGSGGVNWSLSEIGALPLTGGSIAGQLFVTYSGLGGPAIDVTGAVAVTGGVSASAMSADSFYANVAPTVPTELTSKDYVDAKATKDNCTAATFNPIPYGVFDSLTGTITVTYTPFTFTSVASDSITLIGHQFNTGDAVRLAPSVNDASNYLSVNGAAQAVGNTSNRYVIKVDANTIKIATFVSNALAGTATTVTITGTVTVTVNIAAVIDGQTIGADSRVLVKSQTAAAANGIYFMSTTTQNAWVLSRAQDADAWSDLVAALVPISQGTINTGSLWLCTIGSSGTLNTGSITFKALGSKDITYGQPNSASPTITAVGSIQASKFIRDQGAPATQNTVATLTSAQIAAGILQTTPTGAIALTLPTGTTMEENAVTTGEAYDFYIINTSAYAVTINGNTGHTIVGNATIAANTSAHWCIRKTATNTFVSYRVA